MSQGAKPGEGGELPGYKVSILFFKVDFYSQKDDLIDHTEITVI